MSIFSSIRAPRIRRTRFNLSNDWAATVPFGKLIPFFCTDVVPGDNFKMTAEVLVETFPMLADIYGQIDVKTEYFFVPNRLLMDDWESFITGGPDGNNASAFIPRVPAPSFDVDAANLYGTLWDYFGLPIIPDASHNVQFDSERMPIQLPFMAYRKIWNDWYRNENLQDETVLQQSSFDSIIDPLYRNWKKDYFTSALPFVQRGPTPLVQVGAQGVQGSLNVTGADFEVGNTGDTDTFTVIEGWTSQSDVPLGSVVRVVASGEDNFELYTIEQDSPTIIGTFPKSLNRSIMSNGIYAVANNDGNVALQRIPVSGEGNISFDQGTLAGLSFDINELRRVNAVQKWLERNARAGARYVEQIASHFGVRVPDYRLQRSEFLGGTSTPMSISSIMQTNTPSGTPTITDSLGYEAGKGITSGVARRRSYRVPEHGWIIGLLSIVPKAWYNQGIERKWIRYDRFDYYFPEFAHLGEEPVYNQELYWEPESNPEDPSTFGYQSRYASYKWQRSQFCGDFRETMKFWTLGRDFNKRPSLNKEFIQLDPNYSDLNRIFSVPSNPRPFRVLVRNHVLARRPMPKYGTPSL